MVNLYIKFFSVFLDILGGFSKHKNKLISHHDKAGARSALHSWKLTEENILIERLSLVMLRSIANSSKSNSRVKC